MINWQPGAGRSVTPAELQPLLKDADQWTKQLFGNKAAIIRGFPQVGPLQYAVAVWQNAYHKRALYFNVIGQNIRLAELIPMLKQIAVKHDRLQFSSDEATSTITQQLRQAGFQVIRHTAMGTYRMLQPTATIGDIKTRSQLTATQWQAVVQLSYQNYVSAHTVNPATMTQAQFEKALSDADPQQPGFWVVGNSVRAYVFWFEDEPGELTSAWLGGVKQADTLRLMRAVLPLVQANYRVVNGEFDDTDPYAWAVYRRLAIPDLHPLVTWQLLLR
ncbi:hypothetical protein FD51_GL001216 [Lacticaseibacillus zeae DSM 20178 = KCTC 3804]|uniref:Uncharacterized protein n=1 Tax=Lacticaseibacillus zeae DSM 20178 = KCTC 3804 TaxID=1423816 RepID=A0A0R1EVN6_LACZE|nr:hypothetical protein [Lacticaseibacillus zeae]KRK11258.1 hypothetical protein FD51_GL001216 [Lacticaseibacillus zeae DSM 20178 = KCTC 3804]OLS07392.1 hypothetical protein AUQ39_09050 [Lacticaseibacillus casei]QVI31375.1 hypothetical protein KG087_10650 [Lacticaseibacillus zeae]